MNQFLSRIRPPQLFAALLVLVLLIWVVTCIRQHGRKSDPMREPTVSAPPPTPLSTDVPEVEKKAEQRVDSLNRLQP